MSPIERGRDEGIRGAEDQISADHEEEGDSSPVQRVLQETQIPGRDAVIDRVGEDGGHGVQDDDKKDGNTAQTIQIGNPMFHNMRVTPKFCVKSNECRNRAKFICRRQRLDRLPPMSTT